MGDCVPTDLCRNADAEWLFGSSDLEDNVNLIRARKHSI